MDSKLRDKIAEALAVQGVTDGYICDKTKAIADSILSLLARELEKARFLDDIVRRVDDKSCYEGGWCVLADTCDGKMWCRGIEAAFLTKRGECS